MRERPILFSATMVRAILEGRKTQTRRVLKPQPEFFTSRHPAVRGRFDKHEGQLTRIIECPYGAPGDRLWVKERWRPYVAHSCAMDACDCGDVEIEYRADGEKRFFLDGEINEASPDWSLPKAADRGDVSPLFMPRWASRITLEVTGGRVERLQDISQKDALAEGAPPSHPSIDCISREYGFADFPRSWFGQLWESINGAGSWAANPWVWVVEFRRIAQEAKAA